MRIAVDNAEEVVKEMMWTAWRASSVFGMGIMQDKPNATKEEVWARIKGGGHDDSITPSKPNEAHADYVFGRMMKLYLTYGERYIDLPEAEPRTDYQSWGNLYHTYQALLETVLEHMATSKISK